MLTESERETILALSEKYFCISLHKLLFCPQASDDEERDLALQTKIR